MVGHVYVNDNTKGTNTIGVFDRHADGSLTPAAGSAFAAGGAGTGAGLASQGAIQITPGSGGTLPDSVSVHGHLVYVANSGAGGANYTGFRLGFNGRLFPIPGSTVTLAANAAPAPVGATGGVGAVDARLSPDGRFLYVDESRIGKVGAFAVNGGNLTELGTSPFALPAGATPAGIAVS